MIELAAPRPDRPNQIRRRFAQDGQVVEMNGCVWPFVSPEVDRAFDNLRATMASRIDMAFDLLHLGMSAANAINCDAVVEGWPAPMRADYLAHIRDLANKVCRQRLRGEL